jgi:hippurate hydrolase
MAADPLVTAAEIILALQTVVARSVDPADTAVVSCTEIHTDGIRNAIPTHVEIKGDTRSYSPQVQALLEKRMREICQGIASAHGCACEVEYTHEFVPTINWPQCVDVAVRAAQAVVGPDNVDANVAPMMTSEDFGRFLQEVPGAFVLLGNGAADTPGGIPLHNSRYDFNDAVLPVGARYFAELVRQRLPRAA